MGLNQTYQLLHSIGNYEKKKKRKKRQTMEWQKILANDAIDNFQNVQIACTTQYKKHQPNQKMGGRPKQTFLQRRQTAGQQASKKMPNNADYQRNANQNHNRVSPHTGQNSYHQTFYKE